MNKFSTSLALLAMLGATLPNDFCYDPIFNLNRENNQDALKSANEKIEKARQERLKLKAARKLNKVND
jgi:hypothetical protein